MAMMIVQTAGEALEIVIDGEVADRLEPNAQRVVELPEGVAEILVRRVLLTEIEESLLAETGEGTSE